MTPPDALAGELKGLGEELLVTDVRKTEGSSVSA